MSTLDGSRLELQRWSLDLRDCLESNKGLTAEHGSEWKLDSESMLQKSGMHALSVLDLLELTKPELGETNVAFIDHYSVQSIVRSVLESYLVFHYIFLDESVGIRVKKLRHKIWHASSLSQRQRQSRISGVIADLLTRERREYLYMRRQILNSATIDQISLPQINYLQRRRPFDWKPQGGWRGIALNTYLSETFWVDMYNTLSSTAHSGAVVSNNMTHPDQKRVQEQSASAAVGMLNLVIPLFIEGYASLFQGSSVYLENNSELQLRIEIAKGVVQNWGTSSSLASS